MRHTRTPKQPWAATKLGLVASSRPQSSVPASPGGGGREFLKSAITDLKPKTWVFLNFYMAGLRCDCAWTNQLAAPQRVCQRTTTMGLIWP